MRTAGAGGGFDFASRLIDDDYEWDADYSPEYEELNICPQPGPQTVFMSTPADIAIYGGSAGGGKTWALLLEYLRNHMVPNFGAVIFRRTFPQITNIGGLWDESVNLFPKADGIPTKSSLLWSWPGVPSKLQFKHLQNPGDEEEWQGAQIPYIGFDELTHFTKQQFFYLLSRNRSTCGVNPYMRGTCNPDPNSWVKDFIAPWLDSEFEQPDGRVGRLESGELAYFSNLGGDWQWHTRVEYEMERLMKKPVDRNIKSLTFVRASVFDNKVLLRKNPQYLASLRALPLLEQERLLWGNWDISEAGNMFREEWFPVIQPIQTPIKFKRIVRFWDLASTKPGEVERRKDDPDYTAGALLGLDENGQYTFLDLVLIRDTPDAVDQCILTTARSDRAKYPNVETCVEKEPGSSGEFVVHHMRTTVLNGFRFDGFASTGSKIARAKPVSGHAQQFGINMVQGHWNKKFLGMATAFFTKDVHDDPVDALSGAYNVINAPPETDTYSPLMASSNGWGRFLQQEIGVSAQLAQHYVEYQQSLARTRNRNASGYSPAEKRLADQMRRMRGDYD